MKQIYVKELMDKIPYCKINQPTPSIKIYQATISYFSSSISFFKALSIRATNAVFNGILLTFEIIYIYIYNLLID